MLRTCSRIVRPSLHMCWKVTRRHHLRDRRCFSRIPALLENTSKFAPRTRSGSQTEAGHAEQSNDAQPGEARETEKKPDDRSPIPPQVIKSKKGRAPLATKTKCEADFAGERRSTGSGKLVNVVDGAGSSGRGVHDGALKSERLREDVVSPSKVEPMKGHKPVAEDTSTQLNSAEISTADSTSTNVRTADVLSHVLGSTEHQASEVSGENPVEAESKEAKQTGDKMSTKSTSPDSTTAVIKSTELPVDDQETSQARIGEAVENAGNSPETSSQLDIRDGSTPPKITAQGMSKKKQKEEMKRRKREKKKERKEEVVKMRQGRKKERKVEKERKEEKKRLRNERKKKKQEEKHLRREAKRNRRFADSHSNKPNTSSQRKADDEAAHKNRRERRMDARAKKERIEREEAKKERIERQEAKKEKPGELENRQKWKVDEKGKGEKRLHKGAKSNSSPATSRTPQHTSASRLFAEKVGERSTSARATWEQNNHRAKQTKNYRAGASQRPVRAEPWIYLGDATGQSSRSRSKPTPRSTARAAIRQIARSNLIRITTQHSGEAAQNFEATARPRFGQIAEKPAASSQMVEEPPQDADLASSILFRRMKTEPAWVYRGKVRKRREEWAKENRGIKPT